MLSAGPQCGVDVGEGLSVSTVCPRLGCAGQDWGPGHSSHHPDDDMRGDQPTLCSHTQG